MNAHMEARIADIEATVEFHYADCDPVAYLEDVKKHLLVGVLLKDSGDALAWWLVHEIARALAMKCSASSPADEGAHSG